MAMQVSLWCYCMYYISGVKCNISVVMLLFITWLVLCITLIDFVYYVSDVTCMYYISGFMCYISVMLLFITLLVLCVKLVVFCVLR